MPIKPPPPRFARHPFEVCVMVSFVASALSLAAFGAPDTATAEDLGYEVMVFLGVAIAISAVVTLIGAFWKDAIIAAFFEAAGLFGVWVPTCPSSETSPTGPPVWGQSRSCSF